ncbi:MAG: glycosyltransferase [Syntrophobacterales bacterium]|nr:glycosyltransferase [Syntrophobacterales bacterium]
MIKYQFIPGGLFYELNVLDDKETIDHLRNYLGNFLLDPVVARVYLSRFLKDKETLDRNLPWVIYLLNKSCDLDPIDQDIRELRQNITGIRDPFLSILKRYSSPHHIVSQWRVLSSQALEVQRRALWSHLKAYPYSVDLIWRAYLLDLNQNVPVGSEWLDIVKIPPEVKTIFEELLMQLNFLQENMEEAYVYYEKTKKNRPNSPRWLNCAAEIAYCMGDTSTSISLYEESLRIDKYQTPIIHRINQISNPLRVDYGVVDSSLISIFLYSYNKSTLLKNTLLSLAGSLLGKSRVVILINGCTDDSIDIVNHINREHFGGRIEIISLPVNIGAPAARNWLLSTSAAKESDYVAFLDDDVEVPSDWLVVFLNVMKNYPKAGVVGAKVVYPGRPKRLQYLYRNISVAKEGFIRLSLDVPYINYDPKTYDFVRPTTNVMGCCHVFSRQAIDKVGGFDIRFSPSQMDDIAHDLDLRINGFDVIYCGLVECVHYQLGGVGRETQLDFQKVGNVMGNDVKFFYRFYPYLSFLKRENNLGH